MSQWGWLSDIWGGLVNTGTEILLQIYVGSGYDTVSTFAGDTYDDVFCSDYRHLLEWH